VVIKKGEKMKKLLFAGVVLLIALAAPARTQAHTTENALFTCAGELIKSQGNGGKSYYDIVESWKDDMPMDCYVDEGKVLRQVLAVCHEGDFCTVSAKGESGNGNRYLIQKVFDVQRQPASRVRELKQDTKQSSDGESIGWMKSYDVSCSTIEGKTICNPLDHYTDAYRRGETCATYGVPFYDRPNGNPIGLVWGEMQIVPGEKSKDGKWTHIWTQPGQHMKDGGVLPYSAKTLHQCG
jgi:hypothetical protein